VETECSYIRQHIKELVAKLNDLSACDKGFLKIIPYGSAAVPSLVELLLSGPSLHPQPRCLAAEALGILGGAKANQGLINVLSRYPLDQLNPQLRMSERAVRNRACLELARLEADEAIFPLLRELRENRLEGAARALTLLRVKPAIPMLVECLEDDFVRQAAAEGLAEFSPDSIRCLRETVFQKKIIEEAETSGSVSRRAEAVRLLAELDFDFSKSLFKQLQKEEPDPVRFNAAMALVAKGNEEEKREVLQTLLDFRERGDWRQQTLSEEAILSLGMKTLEQLLREAECQSQSQDGTQGPRLSSSQAAIVRKIVQTGNLGKARRTKAHSAVSNDDDVRDCVP
jgi:HEAT repeat protein